MLTENDVIDRVCRYLMGIGWHIVSRATTTQTGYDIVATRQGVSGVELRVEAKGGTSSKQTTARFGKPFTSSQVPVHVAQALCTAIAMQAQPTQHGVVRVAMAFPDTKGHRKHVGRIEQGLHRLGVGVFWVDETGEVTVDAPWDV